MSPEDIHVGDVFVDLDKRMGLRRLEVTLLVNDGRPRAELVPVGFGDRRLPGKAVRIRLDRLATARLFTRVGVKPGPPINSLIGSDFP